MLRKRRWHRFPAVVLLSIPVLAVLPAHASAGRIALGVYVRGASENPSLVDLYAKAVGRRPLIVSTYHYWSEKPFQRRELREIGSRRALPMVTWEPWDAQGNGYRLGAIANGRYDAYVRASARAAKSYGAPLFLRFAHEMNGDWAPWEGTQNGSSPRKYIAAWRHVVRVFRHEGAKNVSWVWCPYVDNGNHPFRRYYPGDRWVDWTCLDGFNYGAPLRWRSFSEIFADSYRILVRMTSKPIIIGETGSGELGGNKAAWFRSTFRRQLPRLRRVRAVVMFSATHPSGDLRVDSSPRALTAFRNAIDWRKYNSSLDLLLKASAARRAAFCRWACGRWAPP